MGNSLSIRYQDITNLPYPAHHKVAGIEVHMNSMDIYVGIVPLDNSVKESLKNIVFTAKVPYPDYIIGISVYSSYTEVNKEFNTLKSARKKQWNHIYNKIDRKTIYSDIGGQYVLYMAIWRSLGDSIIRQAFCEVGRQKAPLDMLTIFSDKTRA